ncbi:MAG: hypothetical protein M3Y72_08755 [Acidobacteriota bacterium]|nr:hypothetical protein [Acidobacteriota bacterium]
MRLHAELLEQQTRLLELQAERNRLNAQLSAARRTPYGKAKSSLNAVKNGLTGRTVLLHDDDAEAYRTHIAAYENEYKPVGLRESELVQSLADTQWRLARTPGLEMAIYTRGRCEFADRFEDQAPELRTSMIELETHLKYEKQLRNLQLQESRLARRFEKEKAELRELQKQRQAATELHAATSVVPNSNAVETKAASATTGFVFSNTEATDNISPVYYATTEA